MNQEVYDLQKSQNMPFAKAVEILINQYDRKDFKFPDDSEFATREVIGMFVTFPSNLVKKSRSGFDLLENEILSNSFVTITSNGVDFIKNAPIEMFNVAGKPLIYVPIHAKGLTLRDCQITLGEIILNPAAAGGVTPQLMKTVQITFIYL
jgi:hypothetical protein